MKHLITILKYNEYNYSRITAVGAYVPDFVLSNKVLETMDNK
jgi:hypothetical protein